ncbi:MAG: nuclear transport factor 2 family protein [Dokdonella sp.]
MQKLERPEAEANDVEVLEALARDWVEIGWRHSMAEPFNFRERLGDFYDWSSPDTLFFDDFDPSRSVSNTAAQYAALWDATVPQMISLTNRMIGSPSTIVSGNLAVMSVQFITRFEADGTSGEAHTLSSLVWKRTEGRWRITREHGSGLKK